MLVTNVCSIDLRVFYYLKQLTFQVLERQKLGIEECYIMEGLEEADKEMLMGCLCFGAWFGLYSVDCLNRNSLGMTKSVPFLCLASE